MSILSTLPPTRLSSNSRLCNFCLRSYLQRSKTTSGRTRVKESKDTTNLPFGAIKGPERTVVVQDAVYVSPELPQREQTVRMRTYKPRTPGVRHLRRPINDHLWKGRPLHKLTFPKKGQGKGGRNNRGRITVRHRGGGAKRRIRIVDFDRKEPGKHVVERIEYDPGRTAHIALVKSMATEKLSYIITAEGMRAGDTIESYRSGIPDEVIQSIGGTMDAGMLAAKTALRGNCLPIRMAPVGTQVYNVGSTTGKGAVFCRSAGTFAIIVSKEEERRKIVAVVVRLQSGELRKVSPEACCTIGVASNPHFKFRQLGKAGRKRWLGIRPTVRGLAMNKVDHPHGGGRGKSKSNRIPTSPWGTIAKSGFKTRPKHKKNPFLVQGRPRNQGRKKTKKQG